MSLPRDTSLTESILTMNRPFIWAHRGASALAPENTLAAFDLAVEAGADGIELDINLSSDGVPVVLHDETLDRTTNGRGEVCRVPWAKLRQFDAGIWFSARFAGERIPALAEVLDRFGGRVRLNLELKSIAAGAKVLDLLQQYPDADIVVSSFDYPLLDRLRRLKGDLPLAVLFEKGNWYRAVRFADDLRARSFHPEAGQMTRPMAAACRRLDLPVHVWTVNERARGRSLRRSGATGLFTDDPTVFL